MLYCPVAGVAAAADRHHSLLCCCCCHPLQVPTTVQAWQQGVQVPTLAPTTDPDHSSSTDPGGQVPPTTNLAPHPPRDTTLAAPHTPRGATGAAGGAPVGATTQGVTPMLHTMRAVVAAVGVPTPGVLGGRMGLLQHLQGQDHQQQEARGQGACLHTPQQQAATTDPLRWVSPCRCTRGWAAECSTLGTVLRTCRDPTLLWCRSRDRFHLQE